MATELVVFSDDWGRHPSSCQHLVRRLLDRYRVLWVETIGTRRPRLNALTLRRGAGKLRGWLRSRRPASDGRGNPRVLDPVMWPSFGSPAARALNRWLLARAVSRALTPADGRVVVTTIPVTAELVGRVDAGRWVYYCCDDLAAWPGLDGRSLRTMEDELIEKADAIVAVSEVLVEKMAAHGRRATLLTHGVDLDHWSAPGEAPGEATGAVADLAPPLVVFWGVVDRRLNTDWLARLAQALGSGSIVLAGPPNCPDPALAALPGVRQTGPLPYASLPALARAASVLVMPYDDLPATRALQPLKLKEYLATGKPVVVSDLPANAEWRDACDVVDSADGFAEVVRLRLEGGLPPEQAAARRRLAAESWEEKARTFERVLRGGG